LNKQDTANTAVSIFQMNNVSFQSERIAAENAEARRDLSYLNANYDDDRATGRFIPAARTPPNGGIDFV
jgi:hypothetical protein